MKRSQSPRSARAVILTFILAYGGIGLSLWLIHTFSKPAPPRYVLTETDLRIWSGKWVVIPPSAITKVRFAHPTDGRRTSPGFRGQLLHYAERYWFPETGEIEVYADNIETLVVLETPKGKYGVGPYNPTFFAAQLEHGVKGTYLVRPAPPGPPTPWYWSDTALAVYFVGGSFALSVPLTLWRLKRQRETK